MRGDSVVAEARVAAVLVAAVLAVRGAVGLRAVRGAAGLAALRAASLRAELRVPSPLIELREAAGLARLRGATLSLAAGFARRGAGRFAESTSRAVFADLAPTVLRVPVRGLAADLGGDAADDLRDVGFFVVAKRV